MKEIMNVWGIRIGILFLLILVVFHVEGQSPEAKASALLNKMTIEEKVGQMTQVTFAVIAENTWGNTDGKINKTLLKKAIQEYKVGSILNAAANALDRETWNRDITEIQDEAQNTRLKIPVLYGLDGMHGQTYTLNSTLFPHNIALAASRNPQLARLAAEVTAKELRASGVRWNFAPVLDIGRQPLWSRVPETFGEDVYIVKTFGAEAVKGYEQDGLKSPTAVASCMKHYLGYSNPRTGKDRTPAYIPEIELREYYLPQFHAAIKAGSSTIMINSNEINGEPVHASKYLLTDVLQKELGFNGLIVSDWEDIIRLHTWHKVAATPRQAVVMGVNAGVDMSMVPSNFSFYDLLLEAVQKKEVTVTRIDQAVHKILTLKYKLGLMDNPYPEPAAIANFGLPEYQDLALNAAREAMTLLKNKNHILPLEKNTKVLVAGPSAQSHAPLNGAWSYVWQGNEEKFYPADSKTIFEAIEGKVGKGNAFTPSVRGFNESANFDIERLKAASQKADVIVLCIGENAYAESPGTIRDLALPANQVALVEVATSMGKPVILVLTQGRPRFISSIEPRVDGILNAYWSGKKTGDAVADVLFGDYNPDGRLPYTYPRSMGELVLYDRKPSEEIREVFNDNVGSGYDPLFPFGYGLSYTTFSYSEISLSAPRISANGSITANITVTNTGNRSGKHSVEIYTHDKYASITPPVKRLRGFQKIELKPGESKEISFTLTPSDLAFVDRNLKWVTEPGEFEIYIGDKKASFEYF